MAEPSVELPLNHSWTEWSTRAMRQAAPGWLGLVREMAGLQDAFAASSPPQESVAAAGPADQRRRPHADREVVFGRFHSGSNSAAHGDGIA